MLVDQNYADVLALGGESLESCLDSRIVRLVVDHEEVLLLVGPLRDMLSPPKNIVSTANRTVRDLAEDTHANTC